MKTLTTERLILREWTYDDVEDHHEYAKSPLVGPSAGWQPHKSIAESEAYLKKTIADGDTWALVYRENNKVIGSLGLHADKHRQGVSSRTLGYVLSADYWGRGLMREAVNAALDFAFTELDLQLVSVVHFPDNHRSKRVIQKCGFRFEGITKGGAQNNGTAVDTWCYSITKAEWKGEGGRPVPNHRFYQNPQCEYFPCHKTSDPEHFSCQFCYCPLYRLNDCGGNFELLSNGIKDCTNCLKPHYDYDGILKKLR
ncbi:MAG: GNAT family N-acetyltransferase [Clostridia bacterium]|nr:GNAT family N-acetyltransferase [Clostridia bacterium]